MSTEKCSMCAWIEDAGNVVTGVGDLLHLRFRDGTPDSVMEEALHATKEARPEQWVVVSKGVTINVLAPEPGDVVVLRFEEGASNEEMSRMETLLVQYLRESGRQNPVFVVRRARVEARERL